MISLSEFSRHSDAMDNTKVLKYILPCFFVPDFELLTAQIFYVKYFTITVLVLLGVREKISMRAKACVCFLKET